MIPDELKRRFHRFLNKYGTEGSMRHSRLGLESAQKSLTNGAALAIQNNLDMDLFREQFYGYEAARKRHDGSTFEKGIIGISLEYFETHPEELSLDIIREICKECEKDLSRCLDVFLGAIRHRCAQQGLEDKVSRTHLAMARSGCESIWHSGINDLAHELTLLLDKIEYDKRRISPPTMNITAHELTVIGNGNTINAILIDLSRELEALRTKIEYSDELAAQVKSDTHKEIATIEQELTKPKPDKSIIMKAWDVIQTINAGKEFYDWLKPLSLLLMKYLAGFAG